MKFITLFFVVFAASCVNGNLLGGLLSGNEGEGNNLLKSNTVETACIEFEGTVPICSIYPEFYTPFTRKA